MKKITKLLIIIAIIMTAISVNAQQNCGVVCHNGTLLTGVNERAVEGHITHGDTFITTDCNYVETGTECESLGLPKFSFSTPIERGINYTVSDIQGRVLQVGITDETLFSKMEKNKIVFLVIEGYQPLKFYKQ